MRINHGVVNQAALEKGHVKNKWISSSSKPHRQQSLLMCLENLPARAPVGIAFLRNLQPKVCTLGVICLFFQIWFRRWIVSCCTCLGAGSPSSCKFVRQAWYADFVVHLPVGVSFQHRISSSCDWIIGVCLIKLAIGCWKSMSISWQFHSCLLASHRSFTWAG
jgi:hypothetical protein